MELQEAIRLLQHAAKNEITTWADLGCGDGLFTKALSALLVEGSLIYAVDKSKRSLNNVQVEAGVQLQKLPLDFVKDELPFKNLSGILMANSFHFVKNKNAFIEKLLNSLNKDGYFLFVEYDSDVSNLWVPYPLSFKKLQEFFDDYNYNTEKLNETPSRYRGRIYSAIVMKR